MDSVLEICLSIMSKVGSAIQPKLCKSDFKIVKTSPTDHITWDIDLMVEQLISSELMKSGLNFILVSEDSPLNLFGSSPQYIIILDPIDGTDLIVRGLHGAISSLFVMRHNTNEPVCAVILDIATNQVYFAANSIEGAYCNNKKITPANTELLSHSLVSIYAPKPERLLSLCRYKEFIKKVYRIHNYGGALALAQLANGQIDAVVEMIKGFRNIDFAAGFYIAERAGAYIRDLEDKPISIDLDKDKRQKFIAASTRCLYEEIKKSIHSKRL